TGTTLDLIFLTYICCMSEIVRVVPWIGLMRNRTCPHIARFRAELIACKPGGNGGVLLARWLLQKRFPQRAPLAATGINAGATAVRTIKSLMRPSPPGWQPQRWRRQRQGGWPAPPGRATASDVAAPHAP